MRIFERSDRDDGLTQIGWEFGHSPENWYCSPADGRGESEDPDFILNDTEPLFRDFVHSVLAGEIDD